MSAIVIRAEDGAVKEIEPENGIYFRLQEMRVLVGCELIQVITTRSGRIMIIDDEGKFTAKPMNREATIMVDLFPGDYIAGDALVCSEDQLL